MIKTTTNLKLAARKLDRPIVPMVIALAVFGVAGLLAFFGRDTPAQPDLKPIILIATAQPRLTPAGITVAAVQPRWIPAFDQPAGNVLGAVPMPELGALLTVRSDGWAMIEWDGGPKWLRAADIGLNIADVSPERVVVVMSTPEPSYQVANEPPSDWYTDLKTPEPAFVDALTQGAPDALACGGSPLCGGLTNAAARAAAGR